MSQCGQFAVNIAMSDLTQVRSDMTAAENRIRAAMKAETPARRCDAVMSAYWHTPKAERDAFVAVLISRLTLVRPAPPATTTEAA